MSSTTTVMPRPLDPLESHRFSRRQLLKVGAAGITALTLGGALESMPIRLVRQTIRLRNWDANGLRVAHLSDFHLMNERAVVTAQAALRLALAQKPDLMLFTGDFVTEGDIAPEDRIRRTFSILDEHSVPCIACLGNHDYDKFYRSPVQVCLERSTRIKILRNEATEFEGVSIVGIEDGFHGKPDWMLANSDRLSKSRIMLYHEPDFAIAAPATVSLILSGHTHGGEICLPGGHPLILPRGGKEHVAGLYQAVGVPIYVTRGVGTLGPARIFCPAEVNILTLHST